MDIAQLANLLGVTQADAQGFVDCLRVWTDKGHSIESAIEQNLATWHGLMTRTTEGLFNSNSIYADSANTLMQVGIEAFYPVGGAA